MWTAKIFRIDGRQHLSTSILVCAAAATISLPVWGQQHVQDGRAARESSGTVPQEAGAGTNVEFSVAIPAMTLDGPSPAEIAPVPAATLTHLVLENDRTMAMAGPAMHKTYPKDSIMAVATARARAWVRVLQQHNITGLQLDPFGTIAVMAGQEDLAQRQIAARLATPHLPLIDRAYTLQNAVASFSDMDHPERLPIAERYLTALDAMGKEWAYWQIGARHALMSVYYHLGRSSDVVRIGTKMFDLTRAVPYELLGLIYDNGLELPYYYTILADALSGRPDGKTTMQGVNTTLLTAPVPPPALVAIDQRWTWLADNVRGGQLSEMFALAARLGEQGTPLAMNYWANRGPTRDSQTVRVNDGTIRVIEIGGFECEACMAALAGLERMHQQYPTVEFNFLTWGVTTWKNRVVAPREGADRLVEHMTKDLHVTFPIGIALPTKRVKTEDDGEVGMADETMFDGSNYVMVTKPTIYILDGKGLIRRVVARYDRDLERNITDILDFLLKETQQPVRAGSAPPSIGMQE